MLLTVRHTTTYAFDVPMRFITQSHRLTPANTASQNVRAWSVAAEGATFGAAFTDGAGDRLTTMTVQGPVERIEIVVAGEVETSDTHGVLRDHREMISPVCYLASTAATTPTGALLELVTRAVGAARAASSPARTGSARRWRRRSPIPPASPIPIPPPPRRSNSARAFARTTPTR